MSLLPFLHRVKAATNVDEDDQEKSSRVSSKPVRDKVRQVVRRGWPPISTSLDSYMIAMHAQWNHNKIVAFLQILQ